MWAVNLAVNIIEVSAKRSSIILFNIYKLNSSNNHLLKKTYFYLIEILSSRVCNNFVTFLQKNTNIWAMEVNILIFQRFLLKCLGERLHNISKYK
jgi:hypothetical protein